MVDLLIEVRDARVPASCEDPMFERIAAGKKRVVVFSQADLASPRVTSSWCHVLSRHGLKAFTMDLKHGKGVSVLRKYLLKEARTRTGRSRRRALPSGRCPLRVMVVGVPNTGKSSLINRLSPVKRTRVGAVPGVTRGPQWIAVSRNLELLDTPGILSPRTDDEVRKTLAITGSVPLKALGAEDICSLLLGRLPEQQVRALLEEIGTDEMPHTEEGVLEALAKRKGFLLPGGLPDHHRAARALLGMFRRGTLGRCSLERPEMEKCENEDGKP